MIEALLLTRAFGVTYFGSLLGTVVVVETLGQIISPTLAGAIFDMTGAYDGALIMFISMFALAFTFFALASRLPWPVRQYPPEPAVDQLAFPSPVSGL